MDSRRRRGGASFSIGHILGDPFALATISIAILGWLIALVGSIITQIRGDTYNRFYWWALAYDFCCIIGVITVVLSATADQYAIAVVGFLGVAITYNTFAVSAVVFENLAAEEASAAGFILLSMVSILWVGYFGSSTTARHRSYVDSFALNKEQRASMRGSRPMSTNPYDTRGAVSSTNQHQQQVYAPAAMNGGLEQSSNVSGYGGGMPANNGSQSRFQPMQSSAPRSPTVVAPPGPIDMKQVDNGAPGPAGGADLGGPAEYPYRAKAIYSYEANPDDANEISFTKHEILEVSDVSGRWWQAKKENGETGIAPSNYLILL